MSSSNVAFGNRVGGALVALTAFAMLATLWMVFFHAPIEERMGVVQKIFYIHVPSAYAMYIGFTTAAIASAVYLIKRKPLADSIALAGAEVGMLFCLIVLITGPLWARKAWGVWWTWDPRLTTTLLAGMVFMAYLALRGSVDSGDLEKRFAAGLAVIGLLNLPLIHYSVQRWSGVHPTVITDKGGGLAPAMGETLSVSFVAFTFLVLTLIFFRTRVEQDRVRVQVLSSGARTEKEGIS